MERMKGLTDIQVKERIEQGNINRVKNKGSNSYGNIIKNNVLTFFNGLNLVLALLVAMVHSYRNMLFVGVVFWNAFIGIVQEIRAKRVLDRMALLLATKATVWRNGKKERIPMEQIVLDDLLLIQSGEQLPVDVSVVSGECEVDESMLTGESDAVHKKEGDKILSGSVVVSGFSECVVIAVGEKSYANQLVKKAKKHQKEKSEIRDALDKIVKILASLVVPLGVLMYMKQSVVMELSQKEAVVRTVASVISMIPDGLVLLSSVVMAVSVVRLSKQKAIVQGLYSVENLARVDVLCLDKTGTITTGEMELSKVIECSDKDWKWALSSYLSAMKDKNATSKALEQGLHLEHHLWEAKEKIAFSSKRKWGAVHFDGKGTFLLGAPEIVLGANYKTYKAQLAKYLEEGMRVLVFAKTEEKVKEEGLPETEAMAFFVLKDKLRANVSETMKYFQEEGVRVLVISGDHPETVSKIAGQAGIADAEMYVDVSETTNDLRELVKQNTVFGRVKPEQKKEIVKALKAEGHVVAMTGDGVNDVLALKEADCSIVMDSGCDVARKVAKVVLKDGEFSVMPQILKEGRRAINNLERSASLFLTKTTFATFLLLFFLFVHSNYPMQPIQMTLIGVLTIGMPAFLLALESNHDIVTGKFINKVFLRAIPTGILAILNVGVLNICKVKGVLLPEIMSTMTVFSVAMANVTLLSQLCRPWKWWKIVMMTISIGGFVFAEVFFRNIFFLKEISRNELMIILFIGIMDFILLFLRKKISGLKK